MTKVRPALIDREGELARLRELLVRPGAPLALTTGRRHVAKTFLLGHAWPTSSTFLFTATRTTPIQDRRQLILDLAADEAGLAEVTSALHATFERERTDRPLVLALSGSAVSTLDALASGGAPLYGRLALHLRVDPLAAQHVAAFVPAWGARDVVAGYGVLGGTPAWWAQSDPDADLADNVACLPLAREGRLRQGIDSAILQERRRGSPTRRSTRPSCGRSTTPTSPARGSADTSGLKLDPSLVRRLERLVALGLVAITPVEEAPRNAPVRYRLVDAELRLHHAFVTPNAPFLERGDPADVTRTVVAPRLDAFLGPAFEPLAAPRPTIASGRRRAARWSCVGRAGRGQIARIDRSKPASSPPWSEAA